MSNAKVLIANQIPHDLVILPRIFIHRNSQDIDRIIRFVAVFNTFLVTAFVLAFNALVTLAYCGTLIAFAYRNNDRRFALIGQFNSNMGNHVL